MPLAFRILVALICLLLAWPRPSAAADWPMLGRDAFRNSVSPEKHAPLHWILSRPSAPKPTAWNVRWEAKLGSNNFASPAVADGLVWIGTNNDQPRDPKIKGDAAVLMCFRESDGQFLWQYVSERLPGWDEDYPRAGINCTPLVEGDRLTFVTNRGEVVCLDIALLKAGKGAPRELWKLDMRKQLGVRLFGLAMNLGWYPSPAGYKGRLYIATGNGVNQTDKLPAPNAPSLVCLDGATGKVLWSDRSPGKDIIRCQWGSPLVAEIAGRAQVIVGQGDGWLRSFNPLTGELLWKFDLNPKKAKPYQPGGGGEKSFPLATPVLCENRIYLATGQEPDDGNGVGHLWCIDPTKMPKAKDRDVSPVGDNFDPKHPANRDSALVWHYGGRRPKPKDDESEFIFGRTLSSVAVHDGLVIAPEVAGYIHCLDARTGKPLWVEDVQEAIYHTPLIADGKVYVGTTAGRMVVLALSRERRLLASNSSGWNSGPPVFVNGTLYLSAGPRLVAVRDEAPQRAHAPGHWPQWRGPARDNVSKETGLLNRWPEGGPPLAWQVNGLGNCPGPVAVAEGRVFAVGQRGEQEYLTALAESTGRPLWSVPLGKTVKEYEPMRWLSPRTPVVDDGYVYAITVFGDLVCLQIANGRRSWSKNYTTDFSGKRSTWGFCDHPLVDGDRLICVPAGKDAAVIALDKRNGEVRWKCRLDGEATEHGATVVSTAGGVRHYVCVLKGGLAGVSQEGKLLWRYTKIGRAVGNCFAPLVRSNQVVAARGYGFGVALLDLEKSKEGFEVKEQYVQNVTLPPWQEATVWQDDHLYLGTRTGLACLEAKTGKAIWTESRDRGGIAGQAALTVADGRFYLRSQRGKVVLAEANPKGFSVRGSFEIPGARQKAGATAPVVAGGRLYLRDDERLFVYELLEGAKPGKPASHTLPPPESTEEDRPRTGGREVQSIYVPTPQDVVEKMLELVGVKKSDTVVDLGCGDGRIVVTAARRYGCKAAGYDIDPDCIHLAQEAVKKHKLADLVTIERKDLFTVDLAGVDVLTLYLGPRMNERLLPRLAGLGKGARIVCHAFPLPGMAPDRVISVSSKEDGIERKLYLYTAPLKQAK